MKGHKPMADIPHDESGKKQLFRELTAGMTAQWQQENIENHETLWVGPGIHFLQEESPEAWGRHLRDWYMRINN
jgi:hypothetical protein